MQNIRPYNEENAIKSAAFALELNKEISVDIIHLVSDYYKNNEEFRRDFPIEEPIKSVKIQVNNDVQQISSANIDGLNYLQKSADASKNEWTLRVESNLIAITCNAYSRWDDIWPKVQKYFILLAKIFEDKYSLTKVVVEYLDEFIITSLDKNRWVQELYREESQYVPKFVYEITDPWHSHNGFVSEEDNARSINLINMTFNKSNNPEKNSFLSMQTQHASSFYKQIPFSTTKIDDVFKISVNNHERNKEMLKNILSDGMLKAIKLKD